MARTTGKILEDSGSFEEMVNGLSGETLIEKRVKYSLDNFFRGNLSWTSRGFEFVDVVCNYFKRVLVF